MSKFCNLRKIYTMTKLSNFKLKMLVFSLNVKILGWLTQPWGFFDGSNFYYYLCFNKKVRD